MAAILLVVALGIKDLAALGLLAALDAQRALCVLVNIVEGHAQALLCRSAGVSTGQVDSFDMSHLQEDEPGTDPAAPYHSQHMAAEAARAG